eukprot:4198563-Pyramimonas_sp.AAC.1
MSKYGHIAIFATRAMIMTGAPAIFISCSRRRCVWRRLAAPLRPEENGLKLRCTANFVFSERVFARGEALLFTIAGTGSKA